MDAGDDVDRDTDGTDCVVPHCLKGTGDEREQETKQIGSIGWVRICVMTK